MNKASVENQLSNYYLASHLRSRLLRTYTVSLCKIEINISHLNSNSSKRKIQVMNYPCLYNEKKYIIFNVFSSYVSFAISPNVLCKSFACKLFKLSFLSYINFVIFKCDCLQNIMSRDIFLTLHNLESRI